MADASPTVRRRRLGLVLRGMRERAGLTGEEVGAKLERSGSWLSRVETGRVGLRGRDLRDLLDLYQVTDESTHEELGALAREGKQRGWWSKYADTVAGAYATYIGFEAEAAEVLGYETLCVPGLLQTEQYARALFTAGIPQPAPDLIERKVEVRLARQQLLTRDRPLKFWAIVDESVLHRRLGGADVLRGQLKHLLDVGLLPNVTIQVVPFDVGHHPAMIGSFSLVRFPFPADPDIVYIESMMGDIFADAEDAALYHEIFDHLRASALGPAETRQRIERLLDQVA